MVGFLDRRRGTDRTKYGTEERESRTSPERSGEIFCELFGGGGKIERRGTILGNDFSMTIRGNRGSRSYVLRFFVSEERFKLDDFFPRLTVILVDI